jgi:hypothetical protein
MFYKFLTLLTPDQWSAFGTVLSSAIAFLNLIVVIILVGYNRRTINVLKEQSSDTRAQAQVAMETLSQLKEDRRLLSGRRALRAYGRLQDLNDIFVVIKGEILKDIFKAEDHNPLMPDDWHDISIAVMETWPQGIERTAILENKIRAIQMDIYLLCKPLNLGATGQGIAHVDQLLTEALELLRGIGSDMLHHATGQQLSSESAHSATPSVSSSTSNT